MICSWDILGQQFYLLIFLDLVPDLRFWPFQGLRKFADPFPKTESIINPKNELNIFHSRIPFRHFRVKMKVIFVMHSHRIWPPSTNLEPTKICIFLTKKKYKNQWKIPKVIIRVLCNVWKQEIVHGKPKKYFIFGIHNLYWVIE